MMPSKIKTRFLLLSDTHARAPNPPQSPHPCRYPLPKADVAIHTGDLTRTGKIAEHEHAIATLQQLQAELKIVIPGNHDLTLDTAYYHEKGHLYGPRPKYTTDQLQQIRDLYAGPAAQAANIVYLEEGIQTFQLHNGARLTVYASAYTPEFCEWAFAYPRDHDRYNVADATHPVPTYHSEADTNIDVMLTHGPPHGVLDEVVDRRSGGVTHVGCEHLLQAVSRARPLLHCFGHIHEGWGAGRKRWAVHAEQGRWPTAEDMTLLRPPMPTDREQIVRDMGVYVDCRDIDKGRETMFVNASIMDLRYVPRQAPWVVDLMLDQARGEIQPSSL